MSPGFPDLTPRQPLQGQLRAKSRGSRGERGEGLEDEYKGVIGYQEFHTFLGLLLRLLPSVLQVRKVGEVRKSVTRPHILRLAILRATGGG